MPPRRPSFRSTLDALSHAFVDAMLLAVLTREVELKKLSEEAGTLVSGPAGMLTLITRRLATAWRNTGHSRPRLFGTRVAWGYV